MRELNCEPRALEADFDRVGDTLVSLEEHIREDLMPGPDLLEIADPLTHLVGSWSLSALAPEPGRRPACCGRCAGRRNWPRSSRTPWTRAWAWWVAAC